MTPTLPQDSKGRSIQVLSLKDGGAQEISFSGTSARNSTALTSKVVTLYATEDVRIALGDETVDATATDHFIPASTLVDISTNEQTHIAAIQESTSGTLHISERE